MFLYDIEWKQSELGFFGFIENIDVCAKTAKKTMSEFDYLIKEHKSFNGNLGSDYIENGCQIYWWTDTWHFWDVITVKPQC